MPGYIDSTYFVNFWQPFPEHLWGDIAPIDMLTAEEVSRLPVGDGPFKIVEWNSGDSIRLERMSSTIAPTKACPTWTA
jgi:ABC-type oligopeptide transport system substrate-binding subunit